VISAEPTPPRSWQAPTLQIAHSGNNLIVNFSTNGCFDYNTKVNGGENDYNQQHAKLLELLSFPRL
jgi:hypothetical protein